jgi:hypothetical protein
MNETSSSGSPALVGGELHISANNLWRRKGQVLFLILGLILAEGKGPGAA